MERLIGRNVDPVFEMVSPPDGSASEGEALVHRASEAIIDGDGVTLAVDLGGTHLRAALVDDTGEILVRRSVETPHEGLLPTRLVDLMILVAADRVVKATVVGAPGPVDYQKGRLEWAPHIPATWVAELSEVWLGERLGRPVTLANDADLAAVGEAYFGAGRPYRDLAYLTVSTGIGAGVLLNGRLVHGHHSIAEIGHTIIDRQAWREGRPATLEQLGSGSSVARLSEEAGLGHLDGRHLEAEVARGSVTAQHVWDSVVEAVTIGVLNLSRLFEPQVVIIGGGLGSRERLLGPIREYLAAHPQSATFELLPAQLGDDVGLIGSAAWARAFGP
jgi:glucokinase